MRLLSLIALLCVLGFTTIDMADEISDLTAKAEAGDAEAQFRLGVRYFKMAGSASVEVNPYSERKSTNGYIRKITWKKLNNFFTDRP